MTIRRDSVSKPEQHPDISLSLGLRLGLPFIGAASAVGFLDAYCLLRRRVVKCSACILAYHRVASHHDFPSDVPLTTTGDFEKQIKYLRRRYRLMSLAELGHALNEGTTIPSNAAVVTFDDGYKDNYLNAYPILKRYDVPATVFLATGHIDDATMFWWDKVAFALHKTTSETLELDQLGTYQVRGQEDRSLAARTIAARLKDLPDNGKNRVIEEMVRRLGVDIPSALGKEMLLSWDEIREMAKNGINFGAHTVNHPILTRVSLEQARKEIVESQRRIEENLGQAANTFAYPNGGPGDFNDNIKSILRQNRFVCAVASFPSRLVTPASDPYELGRISPRWTFGTFHLGVSGLYPDLLSLWSRVRRA
jgi:peptidoglycan/xylan/chitin deacetylase (PgdA/CDA1 family)